jgi:hypothetical protein
MAVASFFFIFKEKDRTDSRKTNYKNAKAIRFLLKSVQ